MSTKAQQQRVSRSRPNPNIFKDLGGRVALGKWWAGLSPEERKVVNDHFDYQRSKGADYTKPVCPVCASRMDHCQCFCFACERHAINCRCSTTGDWHGHWAR